MKGGYGGFRKRGVAVLMHNTSQKESTLFITNFYNVYLELIWYMQNIRAKKLKKIANYIALYLQNKDLYHKYIFI